MESLESFPRKGYIIYKHVNYKLQNRLKNMVNAVPFFGKKPIKDEWKTILEKKFKGWKQYITQTYSVPISNLKVQEDV